MDKYNFPVYGTQGGGLVRETKSGYIFVEAPDCPGLDVGDYMPDEWGITCQVNGEDSLESFDNDNLDWDW